MKLKTIEEVDRFAEECHRGQVRKYTGDPYITHPRRVLLLYKKLEKIRQTGSSFNYKAACLLHDVIEDCGITYDQLCDKVGFGVATLVLQLTNKYTKEKYPNLNRNERASLEAVRISKLHQFVQEIKVMDMIDNLTDLAVNDPSYFPEYLREKEFCVKLMSVNKDVLELFQSTVTSLKFQTQEVWPDDN